MNSGLHNVRPVPAGHCVGPGDVDRRLRLCSSHAGATRSARTVGPAMCCARAHRHRMRGKAGARDVITNASNRLRDSATCARRRGERLAGTGPSHAGAGELEPDCLPGSTLETPGSHRGAIWARKRCAIKVGEVLVSPVRLLGCGCHSGGVEVGARVGHLQLRVVVPRVKLEAAQRHAGAAGLAWRVPRRGRAVAAAHPGGGGRAGGSETSGTQRTPWGAKACTEAHLGEACLPRSPARPPVQLTIRTKIAPLPPPRRPPTCLRKGTALQPPCSSWS